MLVVGTAATDVSPEPRICRWRDLYRTTLRSNPSSPMVRNNLGELLRKRAGVVNPDRRLLEEAESQFREALRLRPDDFPQAHNNLGTTLLALDRFDDAGRRVSQSPAIPSERFHHSRQLEPDADQESQRAPDGGPAR